MIKRLLFTLTAGAILATDAELQVMMVDDIGAFTHNPLGYVMYAYPWGEEPFTGEGMDRPRDWQLDILAVITAHLTNPATRYEPLRISVASGHGIGKSALVGMIDQWGRSTCPDTRINITANTDTQLRTKTWPEVTKWAKSAINAHWFKTQATSIESVERGHDKSWRSDAVPWNEKNPEAFAGLHNAGRRLILIIDEASNTPDIIWETIEGALTDVNTEIIVIAFGNPTRNTGRFRECFGKFAHRWVTRQIDSRTVEGTNKKLIAQWVEDYGEDSDFVRIRVKGEFPRHSYNQFISTEVINNCIKYEAVGYEQAPRVFGVDVARFGDDKNSICDRQGRKVHGFRKWYGLDTMQSVAIIVEEYERVQPDAIFVDEGSFGAAVVDRLKQLVPPDKVFGINFGWRKPEYVKNLTMYFNKRAEMWGDMREAMRSGVDIPDDTDLKGDIEGMLYGFSNMNQIQLESKADAKSRGNKSPDDGDSLALTYAQDVFIERIEDRYIPTRVYDSPGTWMS